MRDSKVLNQIRVLCRILVNRLSKDKEPEVHSLCQEYFSPNFDDPFHIASLPQESETTFIVLYSILICLALASNLLAIGFAFKRKSKTSHNSMVLSLTVSSLMMVAFCVPFNMSLISNPFWNNDNAQCKLASYLQNVAVISAMLTPVFIAVDRYLAILRPLQFRNKTSSGVNCFVLAFIWSLAILVSIPNLFWFREIAVHNIKTEDSFHSGLRQSKSSKFQVTDGYKLKWKTTTPAFVPPRFVRTTTKRPGRTFPNIGIYPSFLPRRSTTSTTWYPIIIRTSSTKPPSTTKKQADERFVTRTICVHALDHGGHILIYRSCITALFFISFLIISLTYSVISYELFKRTFRVEKQSNSSFCSQSAVSPHLNLCYHIPSNCRTPMESFALTLLPHYVVGKVEGQHTLNPPGIPFNSTSVNPGEFPEGVHRFYVENGASKEGFQGVNSGHTLVSRTISSSSTDTSASESSESSQKYWIAWRTTILFGATSLSFFASWCPITVFELLLSITGQSQVDVTSSRRRFTFQFLACVSACLNPFFYIILGDLNRLHLIKYCRDKMNACGCIRQCFSSKLNKIEPIGHAEEMNSFATPIQEPSHLRRTENDGYLRPTTSTQMQVSSQRQSLQKTRSNLL